MNDQGSLDFNRPAARRTDPDTTWAAYRSLDIKGRRKLVLDAASALGRDFTASELADDLGLPRDSVSPRLPELEAQGMIHRTDRRRVWESNRKQIVWEVSDRIHKPTA